MNDEARSTVGRPVAPSPADEDAQGGGWMAWLLLAAVVAAAVLAARGMAVVPRSAQLWPWALGRAAGLMAYLLLTVVVLLGLWQAHPWARRFPPLTIVLTHRVHVLLTVFTLCVVVAHVTSLALDPYALVGIIGALVPGASTYRPLPVALGVIALYAGLVTGLTAAYGARLGRRVWLSIHRFSLLVLVAVWFHGVLAGSDTPQLTLFYAITGGAVALLAATRYLAARPSPSHGVRTGGTPQPAATERAAPTRAAAPGPSEAAPERGALQPR